MSDPKVCNSIGPLQVPEKPTLGTRKAVYLLQRKTTRVGKDLGKVKLPRLAILYEQCCCTLHPASYTLHPTPHALHPTPYTFHPNHRKRHADGGVGPPHALSSGLRVEGVG